MRPLPSLVGLPLLAALAACSDSAASGSDDADALTLDDGQGGGSHDSGGPDDAAAPGPGDGTSEAPAFQPDVGLWQYSVQPIRDNTCGSYAVSDGSTPFRILRSANGEFEIEQEEGATNFFCQISGTRYLCPSRLRGSNPVPDTDAVVSFNVAIEGELLSDAELRGAQTVAVSCAGTSCALAPAVLGVSFPCSYVVDFTATAF